MCQILEISRQGFYKQRRQDIVDKLQEEMVLHLVKEIRYKMPRIGGRKLYYMLQSELSHLPLKTGRDKFFDILRRNRLLVQPRRRYTVTTQSHHRFHVYRNLIEEKIINRRDSVFVADITYLRLIGEFCYLFLITDLYSRKIVGYHLNQSLSVEGAIKALSVALRSGVTTDNLIHHSDRGIQYCCNNYVDLLQEHKIEISMGESGNPYDNAVAERVNGILKTEFYLDMTFNNFEEAKQAVNEAVYLYNNLRPHMSIGYLTPSMKYAA